MGSKAPSRSPASEGPVGIGNGERRADGVAHWSNTGDASP